MPISAPGSRPAHFASTTAGARSAHGFTLIELMIVVAIVGLASSLVVLAIRDPAATRLEREAVRLAAMLDSARAEARASGLSVRWVPGRPGDSANGDAPDFRFVGLPRTVQLPGRWLDSATRAEVVGSTSLQLGPEPVIGAQRVVLHLADQHIGVATDGLGPFTVTTAPTSSETTR